MKKIFLITISLFMIAATTLKAGNPIPSFNTPILGKAYFQEAPTGPGTANNQDEKRDMNVNNGGGNTYAPTASVITVYIYRLDMKKIQGPFVVASDETISVQIDNQEWGVIVNTETPTTVSVWIDQK
ncbi:MAG: hypothetical protein NTU98_07400 [Bacteroidetes bacterium]|nr:hypothetical protein [Bacteroidota bacterium]